jgi:predicted esterase
MRRVLAMLVVCLFTTALAGAQEWATQYQQEFEAGIANLTAGKHDEGIANFKRCIELNPAPDGTAAYNIACGYSLKGERDPAFEWLDKAAAWGFGNSDGTTGSNIEHAKKDADLAGLREDPRFEAFIARMTKIRADLEAYWSVPEVYVPAAIQGAEEKPLLVVLHDRGGTKSEVLERWKALADELGWALLAPSAKFPLASAPAEGMSWFDDPNAYTQRYWTYERSVHDAVTAFRKEHKLDKDRVFLAGEGQGGMVAFNVAVSSAGLYKGALVVDGGIHTELAQKKAANAGKLGFRARLVTRPDAIQGLPAGLDAKSLLAGIESRLKEWGVTDTSVTLLPPATDVAGLRTAVLASLRSMEPKATADTGGQ